MEKKVLLKTGYPERPQEEMRFMESSLRIQKGHA